MKYPRSKPFCSREKINVPADYLNLLVKPLNREVVRRMVQFPWSKVVVFVKSILLTHNPALFCTRTAALKQKLKSIPHITIQVTFQTTIYIYRRSECLSGKMLKAFIAVFHLGSFSTTKLLKLFIFTLLFD